MVELVPPLSKSDAQRALVLADILGAGAAIPSGEVMPRDVNVLQAGLVALQHTSAAIECHDGGAPFRFLLTQAALREVGEVTFTGSKRLGERPHEPLLQSLREALRCTIVTTPGSFWPLTVRSSPLAFDVRRLAVTGAESSQFASSLLLGAARVARVRGVTCEVAVNGALTSEGYLQLTQQWVERAGFHVERTGQSWRVAPPREVSAFPPIPGDWSSLTYLLLLGWKFGAAVSRVQRNSGHPDERFAAHLESVHLKLVSHGALVTVDGAAKGSLEVDCEQCPDAVPALVALACVLPGRSTFTRIGILRHKESDRVEGVCDFARRVGATAEVTDTSFIITRAASPRDFEFHARDDHRMAMAATVLSALTGTHLSLYGANTVSKSFPHFWLEAAKVGVSVTRLD